MPPAPLRRRHWDPKPNFNFRISSSGIFIKADFFQGLQKSNRVVPKNKIISTGTPIRRIVMKTVIFSPHVLKTVRFSSSVRIISENPFALSLLDFFAEIKKRDHETDVDIKNDYRCLEYDKYPTTVTWQYRMVPFASLRSCPSNDQAWGTWGSLSITCFH